MHKRRIKKFATTHDIPKVRFMERIGNKVRDMICVANPWKNQRCGGKECEMCGSENTKLHGTCKKEGITYELKCDECEKKGITIKYIGQSSRSICERKKEHDDGQRKMNVENALWKHSSNEHEGKQMSYSAKVTGTYKTVMARRISEWVYIARESMKYKLMNSKGEWKAENIPRVRLRMMIKLQNLKKPMKNMLPDKLRGK